jgi:Flp pilus assembly protein TadD
MKRPAVFTSTLFLAGLFLCLTARAEIKIIEAESTYLIGDNDSKVDGRRIAIQEAKRKALELAGTFVSSLTVVKDYQISKDEVAAYTAGLVETEVASEEMRGPVDRPEIYIKARCTVDTGVLAEQIQRYRESEGLKEQLKSTLEENDKLRKERDDLVARLGAEKDTAKAEETRKKLDSVLSKEEANDEINRLWGTVARRMDISDPLTEADGVPAQDTDRTLQALERASAVNPENRKAPMLLSALYFRSGNRAAAEGTLRKAIAFDPRNPFYRMALGRVLKSSGRFEEALAEFRGVERMRPHNPQLLFETGVTHRATGNCRQAVAYLKRFLRVTHQSTQPRVVRLRDEAVRIIQDCGRKPEGKPGRHRPPLRPSVPAK